jgi:hypothetical protein
MSTCRDAVSAHQSHHPRPQPALNPDALTAVCAQVRLYSAKGAKTKPLAVLPYHTKEVPCVRFAPTSGCAAAAHGGALQGEGACASSVSAGAEAQPDQGTGSGVAAQQWWGCTCGGAGCAEAAPGVCWAAGLLASASRDGCIALWRLFPPKSHSAG